MSVHQGEKNNGYKIREFYYAKELFKVNATLYACCFSEEGDILSQWRAYAQNGEGISIGFSNEVLNDFNKQMYGLKFAPICYDQMEQDAYANGQANNIINLLLKGDTLIHVVSEVYENKTTESGCMKNPSFREEKEWRISITMSPECRVKSTATFNSCTLSEVKMHARNHIWLF